MKIFLDTSDVNVISKHCESGLIDGVTTNPTLMKQSGRNPIDVIKDISALFPDDSSISAEVVADTAEGMISQAKQYYSISPNITIKVPCTEEGLKACNVLSAKNIPVNVTLIFSVTQAILCAKAGAKFVSPFIGRCEDNGLSGIGLIESIRTIFDRNNIKTQILAASIRTTEHVTNAFIAGTDIVTLPPSIFEEMYKHDLTDQGIDQFDKDWKQVNHK
ncbi:MAG: transaldolase family protein [Candidatus Neomarinimicrobiota bacterium]|mgnify:FL=1|tara:strand:+ start:374 stop:1027 length:654 start_codon:yes stop_codon:yes gene_type:complete